jgi:transposase-like protein
MAREWTCATCGETFDALETSALQHNCPVAQFDRGFTRFLQTPAGQFAVYYAQRVINASHSTNLPLAKS